jgi:hypothetical protein
MLCHGHGESTHTQGTLTSFNSTMTLQAHLAMPSHKLAAPAPSTNSQPHIIKGGGACRVVRALQQEVPQHPAPTPPLPAAKSHTSSRSTLSLPPLRSRTVFFFYASWETAPFPPSAFAQENINALQQPLSPLLSSARHTRSTIHHRRSPRRVPPSGLRRTRCSKQEEYLKPNTLPRHAGSFV